MAGFRSLLYSLAKLMGDYNAVKNGNLGQRVGRWAAGKITRLALSSSKRVYVDRTGPSFRKFPADPVTEGAPHD